MNAIEIVREQLMAYERGIEHAVITIVDHNGSTPRTNGKMIVYSNGAAKGTIGGGAVEHLAVMDALECIRENKGICKSYNLTSPSAESGMTCGGVVSVIIEVFTARPLLVMCGAGHIGGAVIHLASFAGFETMLIDDRDPALIEEKIIQEADRFIRINDFEKDINELTVAPGAYFVVATHGHIHDAEALSASLSKEAAYIGMIGSSKKINALFKQLQKKGIAKEDLDKVYAPIGIDIGGETPEEIAISIMAEILMIKNKASGLHWIGKEK